MPDDPPDPPLSKPSLEYDRTAPTVTVRGFRTLLALTLLNTIVLGWFVVGPQLGPFVKAQWQQWQAKREARRQEGVLLGVQKQIQTHTIPAGTIAYTEDPALAATLAGDRKRYQTVVMRTGGTVYSWMMPVLDEWVSPVALKEPSFWTSLRGLKAIEAGYEMSSAYPMIFMHARTTPSGATRNVVVQWVAEQSCMDGGNGSRRDVETSRLLAARMHASAARSTEATLIDQIQVRVRLPEPDVIRVTRTPAGSVTMDRPPPLTLFAGEADPVDASHFTIPYAIGENTGVIDGWVTEDELVLKPRLGEVTVARGQPNWVLGATPSAKGSTRPATASTTRP